MRKIVEFEKKIIQRETGIKINEIEAEEDNDSAIIKISFYHRNSPIYTAFGLSKKDIPIVEQIINWIKKEVEKYDLMFSQKFEIDMSYWVYNAMIKRIRFAPNRERVCDLDDIDDVKTQDRLIKVIKEYRRENKVCKFIHMYNHCMQQEGKIIHIKHNVARS